MHPISGHLLGRQVSPIGAAHKMPGEFGNPVQLKEEAKDPLEMAS